MLGTSSLPVRGIAFALFLSAAANTAAVNDRGNLRKRGRIARDLQGNEVDAVPCEFIYAYETEEDKVKMKEKLTKNGSSTDKIAKEFIHSKEILANICLDEARSLDAWLKTENMGGSIEPNFIFHPASVQTNPTWALDRVDQDSLPLDGAYHYNMDDGTGVDVYILDGYIEDDSSEFAKRVPESYDTLDGEDAIITTNCDNHGMSVAGIAAGTKYGVAKGANVIPVRVLNCDANRATLANVLEGLAWAKERHEKTAKTASIVNLSLTVKAPTNAVPSLVKAIQDMHDAGIVVVVAAGNTGENACDYIPASYQNVITVGATDETDTRPSWSNWGSCIEMFAPGLEVTSIGFDSGESTKSGTSQASPLVAGVAAQILQKGRSLSPPVHYTPGEVLSIMQDLALDDVVSEPGAGSPNLLLRSLHATKLIKYFATVRRVH